MIETFDDRQIQLAIDYCEAIEVVSLLISGEYSDLHFPYPSMCIDLIAEQEKRKDSE